MSVDQRQTRGKERDKVSLLMHYNLDLTAFSSKVRVNCGLTVEYESTLNELTGFIMRTKLSGKLDASMYISHIKMSFLISIISV